MIPSQKNPCTVFTVKLNPDTRTPILGTMMSNRTTWKIPAPCTMDIVPNTQMSYTNACRPSTGLRYWYKVNKMSGNILPNSMFVTTGKVPNQCSGQYSILEYVIYAN